MSYQHSIAPAAAHYRFTMLAVIAMLLVWATAVVVAAQSGFLATLYQPLIGGIVALTIIVPTLLYFASSAMREMMDAVGHRRIIQFHIWRIPAALLFFWYGAQGQLPPLFWILAGVGDLIAGLFALFAVTRPEEPARYLRFHLFGFADFVVAVGTGLTFTLLEDVRMQPVAALPMALVPLFGVGISGATHLMAFDMLRRGAGFRTASRSAAAHGSASSITDARPAES